VRHTDISHNRRQFLRFLAASPLWAPRLTKTTVNTKLTAALSLIEPAIMIFMGMFVAFVLVALYLPIFSLADTIR